MCTLRLAFCVALLCHVLSASADTIIETRSSWTGKGYAPLGGAGMTAFGQSFVAPADPVLQSFTIFIDEVTTTSPVRFRAYVAGWPPAPPAEHPVPPILF